MLVAYWTSDLSSNAVRRQLPPIVGRLVPKWWQQNGGKNTELVINFVEIIKVLQLPAALGPKHQFELLF